MHNNKSSTDTNISAGNLTHEALHDLIHFDVKFLRTLPPLLFRPGTLVKHALTSPENKYVKPFALFVFLNFAFFIFKSKGLFAYTLDTYGGFSWIETYLRQKQSELNLQPALLAERFNTAMHFEQKEYLIIMVPLFALIVYLLYFIKQKYFAQHLVFALYFYCFFIIYLMILPYLFMLLGFILKTFDRETSWLNSEVVLGGLILFINWIYLFFAVRTVYSGGYFAAAWKSAILSFTTYFLITVVYHLALFFIVMHSISG
jgi:Protein of unknown function (DUF3667)